MNRIDKKFIELKEKKEKALITFITAGDPNIETTEKIVLEMERAGADLIEIGIPFSDPVAEGVVIQAASERALKNNLRLDTIFEMVKNLRQKTDMPLLFMMYINMIFKYGADRFFASCKEKGIDGVIVPDIPFEERCEIESDAEKYGVYIINLIAPTSKERIEKIARHSEGFLYCVSSMGVTGKRTTFDTDFDSFFNEIKKYSDVPTALGFGISTAEHIKTLKGYSDGLIVGSAIVELAGKYGKDSPKKIYEFVKELKQATN